MSKSFKYVSDFEFPSECGYTGSAGRQAVKGYMRGGSTCAGYAAGGKIKSERKEMSRVEVKRREAGNEISRIRSQARMGKDEARIPSAAGQMSPMIVPNLHGLQMKKGGAVPKKGAFKMSKVMGEFKKGQLHSGSKTGPKVTNPKQAVAIAISEARRVGKK